MAKFRIQPHSRLQEWVAEEKGYFKAEGLDYEFVFGDGIPRAPTVQSTEEAPPEVKQGAFESMESGRACEISSACHWAVNMASSAQHGLMWGHAYSITPSGLWVPPDSPVRKPEDLAGVEIAVGYHSGSHFSTLQALEKFLSPEQINLRFVGGPLDRLRLVLERRVAAAALFGMQYYIVEQQGYRRVLDTTFMIGFLAHGDADVDDLAKYFRALQRAQRDIDQEPEQYKHYFLREMPKEFQHMVDVRAFGHGERLVFEPYTQEVYEKTHRWMESYNLFRDEQAGRASYQEAVLVPR